MCTHKHSHIHTHTLTILLKSVWAFAFIYVNAHQSFWKGQLDSALSLSGQLLLWPLTHVQTCPLTVSFFHFYPPFHSVSKTTVPVLNQSVCVSGLVQSTSIIRWWCNSVMTVYRQGHPYDPGNPSLLCWWKRQATWESSNPLSNKEHTQTHGGTCNSQWATNCIYTNIKLTALTHVLDWNTPCYHHTHRNTSATWNLHLTRQHLSPTS